MSVDSVIQCRIVFEYTGIYSIYIIIVSYFQERGSREWDNGPAQIFILPVISDRTKC